MSKTKQTMKKKSPFPAELWIQAEEDLEGGYYFIASTDYDEAADGEVIACYKLDDFYVKRVKHEVDPI